MQEMSEKIFEGLKETLVTGEMIPMKALEAKCKVNERGLQSEDGNPGPLDIAIAEIFEMYRLVVITQSGRGGGVKLTNDITAIGRAHKKLASHVWHELKRVKSYEDILEQIQRQKITDKQLGLAL
jgi:hypothetical protein